ncbi:MAG TPA: TIGR00282 family metallophosphoesterase [Dissulfurispiraceae bacterium]|nr:TIGR00282 family metallophosphoesterase [Dissulfurispiraceae bacterium]
MKILFIGDIVGKPGRQAVKSLLPNIVSRYKIDAVVANGENAAGGFGITEPTATELFSYGIEILTTGNHVWDKKEAIPYLIKEHRILRPLNYPPEVPGIGSTIFNFQKKFPVAVLNVSGRIFMNTLDCPFRTTKAALEKIRESAKIIIIDFHAEATSEKLAFAYYVDGKVSAVVGTHTHVQTADERILPGGTAYITDVGMTGPSAGVIGIEKDQIIDKFLTHMPRKFNVAEGKALLSAVVMEIDEQSGKATGIQRLQLTNP